ncbi:MAG: NAD(+)/NADH kinase [Candidatus Jettenia caeni]|nr:NAD(+)/NADH kinase [Candidatus Jettenia sp. AMX1]NUN23937.1 NAD(+)/NADH kinase [Candidatus Jettenia caeni]WKZ15408.1 MAG: NAD(+)/NADH kinase [Candidatus Jettenia caeni]GIL19395.1 MAG: NAD kinase [Candidatus Jettenia caeni]GJQ45053.1 MAG: NAD kinase [Candidatus Jettenia caeni]
MPFKRMKKILVLGDLSRKKIYDSIYGLKPWLEKYVGIEIIDLSKEKKFERVGAEIAIVFGGDGAILSTCRALGRNQIPIIGVHMGRFGFLAELMEKDVFVSLEKIFMGDYLIRKRMLLLCHVERSGKILNESTGINDAVISRSSLSRLISIKLNINGECVATYRADGLIVSTPLGSTAHSLSAGGPLLTPDLNAFIIVPICPHTLTNRPLVVSGNVKIEMELLSQLGGTGFTVDGQVFTELEVGDKIKIERSAIEVQMIDTGTRTFYGVLREKLNWGGHPNYGRN